MSNQYQGPLAGLNVIDFGHYYAGPMAAMLLADQGASVIHIVRPDNNDPSSFHREIPEQQHRLLNRNKKILTLNLKSEKGKQQALLLIKNADVVIENFRPDVMKRLGLDYISMKSINPDLIYLSLPGFASTDKKRAHIQAWEGVLCAATGVYREISLYREVLKYPPLYTWVPLCSMYGAISGSIAIMAALIARKQRGTGTYIEAPLADNGMVISGLFIFLKRPSFALRAIASSESRASPELQCLEYSDQDSLEVQQGKIEKARRSFGLTPTCNSYQCSDDRQIFINTFGVVKITARLLDVLGIKNSIFEEGFVNEDSFNTGLNNNINANLSSERSAWLTKAIGHVLLTKSAQEWEALLTTAGVMASVIRTREEWLAIKPLLISGVFVSQDNGESVLVTPGRVADVGESCAKSQGHFSDPEIISAEDSVAIFSKRSNQSKISPTNQSPTKKSDLLKDLKVLDMANVAAGPIGAAILAEYGASVIKADPPKYLFPGLITGSIGSLIGKRSLLFEIQTAPGREIFKKLVSWSDVVMHNVLDNTALRLGISQSQLSAINPEVISCQFSAFGGSFRGGWEGRPGFDYTLHAATGLMAQYGTLEQPHIHGMAACGDIMGGYVFAFSTLLGVYGKQNNGRSDEVRTSLARAMNIIQLPYMVSENGKSDWGESRGQFSKGESWWQRMYQCTDGWVFVGTSMFDSSKLAKVVVGDREGTTLEEVFSEYSCEYWEAKLDAEGIACHRVMSADDIYSEAEVRHVNTDSANDNAKSGPEIVKIEGHPCKVPLIGLASTGVRIGVEQSYYRPFSKQRLGLHSREILLELGFSDTEITELIRIGSVHEYLPALTNKETFFP